MTDQLNERPPISDSQRAEHLARELGEIWKRDFISTPIFYETQERAMAPGIAGEWPQHIPAPHSKHGRLVKREGDYETLYRLLLAKEAALDQARRERDEAEREVSTLTSELTNLYTEATGYVGTILTAREIIAALMVKAKVGE